MLQKIISHFLKNLISQRKVSLKRTIRPKKLFIFMITFNFVLLPVNTFAKTKFMNDANVKENYAVHKNSNNIFSEIQNSLNSIFHKDYIDAVNKLDNEKKDDSKIDFEKRFEDILKDKKRIDVGTNFVREIIDDNDRMKYYDLYIKLAKAKGYIVTSYIDYLEKYKNTDKKVLILRHDIDEKSDGTRMMFDIEKKNNVKATYYFRWKTFDLPLIKEIAASGFEVGLHYETIATYCLDKHTRTITKEDIAMCREILKEEIAEFKEKTGIDIKTISSHGNPVNREIHMTNTVLLNGQKYSDYGIVSETYDHDIIKNYIKSYICDNDLMKSYGFSYKANPIDSIMDNSRVIEFLSHPSHWYYTVYERAKMYLQVENRVAKK